MEKSRRSFLKIAGVTALGVGAKPVFDVFAASEEQGKSAEPKTSKGKNSLDATQWGMVIDTRKINSEEDIYPIVSVCHKIHNVPNLENVRHEIKWIWAVKYKNAFPGKENKYLNDRIKDLPFLVLCNHCEDPPCVQACPTQATFKRDDGIVLMDFHRCIGCRFCMAGCPYGSRSFNFRDPRSFIAKINSDFPTRMKGVVEKCNFCAERLAVGKEPACVEVSNGILTFGDLEDPESNVRKLLASNYTIRRKQGLGTGPAVYYIV
jgi:molybdopterin-containing oxidoreductase family iron-sulfur binding subunit